MDNCHFSKHLIEHNLDAIIILNWEGKVVYWNNQAIQLFGYSKSEVLGQDISDLILPKTYIPLHNKGFCRFKQTLKSNVMGKILQLTARTKNKNIIPIEMALNMLEIAGERFFSAFIRDNTYKTEKEKELKAKQKELEKYIESNLQLENFAYIASHDLQQPLQNIINFSDYLSKALQVKLNTNELQLFQFIQAGAVRMRTMIQDLLHFSLASHETLKKTNEPLESLLAVIIFDLKDLVTKSKAKIVIGTIPDRIIIDKQLFKHLIQNLLTNSIKFASPNVAPMIHLSVTAQNNYHLFTIKDNGIGIKEEHFKKIFALFKRLHNKDAYDGTGIGLALCKKIVERYGGKIWVESQVGQGSTFFFTIPIL